MDYKVDVMKTAYALVVVFLLAAPLYAQETLIVGDVAFGGYGGPAVQLTSVNGEAGILVGGGGGVIIDHTFAVGGAGYSLVNTISDDIAPAAAPYLEFGYGGVFFQYIHRSDDLFHLTASVLVGGGGLNFRKDITTADGELEYEHNRSTDAFFVAEPALEGELNITGGFRVALGGSYRFISGAGLHGLSNRDLSGPGARLVFKFGSF